MFHEAGVVQFCTGFNLIGQWWATFITHRAGHSCKTDILLFYSITKPKWLVLWTKIAGLALHVLFGNLVSVQWSLLSDPESLQDHSRITPAQFPERSGHASPCSGYAPGGSGSQKQREVGPKTERASVGIFAENIYNSIINMSICVCRIIFT